MVYKLLFCLFTVSCIIQLSSSGDADTLAKLTKARNGIQESKSVVKNIVSELDTIRQTLKSKLHAEIQNTIQRLYGFERTTLSEIEKDAHQRKTDRKNLPKLQKCITDARLQLRSITTMGIKKSCQCETTVTNKMKDYTDKVAAAIKSGQQLISQLDTVNSHCPTSNAAQKELCMSGRLRSINRYIEQYKGNVAAVKAAAHQKFELALAMQSNCVRSILVEAQSGINNAKENAKKCIQRV